MLIRWVPSVRPEKVAGDVHEFVWPPSSEQLNVTASLPANINVIAPELVTNGREAKLVMVTVGGVVSTVHEIDGALVSDKPAALVAFTVKVCVPLASPIGHRRGTG